MTQEEYRAGVTPRYDVLSCLVRPYVRMACAGGRSIRQQRLLDRKVVLFIQISFVICLFWVICMGGVFLFCFCFEGFTEGAACTMREREQEKRGSETTLFIPKLGLVIRAHIIH